MSSQVDVPRGAQKRVQAGRRHRRECRQARAPDGAHRRMHERRTQAGGIGKCRQAGRPEDAHRQAQVKASVTSFSALWHSTPLPFPQVEVDSAHLAFSACVQEQPRPPWLCPALPFTMASKKRNLPLDT